MAVDGLQIDVDAPAGSAECADEVSERGAVYPSYEHIANDNFVSVASSGNWGANTPPAGIQVAGSGRFHEEVHRAFVDAQRAISLAIESAKLKVSQAHTQAFGVPRAGAAPQSPSQGLSAAPPTWFSNESGGRHGDHYMVGFRTNSRCTSQLSIALAAVAAEDQIEEARRTSFFVKAAPTVARWMPSSFDNDDGQGRQNLKEGALWRAANNESPTPEQPGGQLGSAALQPRRSVQRMSFRNPESSFIGQLSPVHEAGIYNVRSVFAKQGSMRSTTSFHKQNSMRMSRQVSMRNQLSGSSAGTPHSLRGSRLAPETSLRVQLEAGSPQPSAPPASEPPETADPPAAAALVLSVRATSRPAVPSEDPPPPPPAAQSMERSKTIAEEDCSPTLAGRAQSAKASELSLASSQGGVSSEEAGVDLRKIRTVISDGSGVRRNSTGNGKLMSVIATKQSDLKSAQEASTIPTQLSATPYTYAFNAIIGIAIILNSVAVAASADTDDWWAWPYIDVVFAVVFTVEMLVKMRFGGFMKYFVGREFFWNLFDFVLLFLAWLEIGMTFKNSVHRHTGLLDPLPNFRMVRAARVMRVCKLSLFADLAMMINGAVYGMRTFLWSQVVLAVPLYMVALLLRSSVGDLNDQGSGAEYFGTFIMSYFTSFRCLVANECFSESGQPIFLLITKNFGWSYAVLYVFMNVLMTFALGNIIVAIFVENTLATAKANELRQKQQRLTDSAMFHRKALELVDLIYERLAPQKDVNWDSPDLQALMEEALKVHLSREVFDELVQLERFQKLLHDMDINVAEQLDLFDTLDVDGGGTIDLEELLTGIHRLRGDARRSDIVGTALRVNAIQDYLVGFEATVNQQFALLRIALNLSEEVGVDATGP